ncbi:MAG: NUDIX hydrolase [Chloroflexota bacterium]
MPERWTILSSRYVLENPWLKVREDRCRTGLGTLVPNYYVVERHDFAMVVALDGAGRVVLVRQYKHGCGQIVVECPAGYIADGEEPAAAAVRELREETGYVAARWEALGALWASPATQQHRMHLFLCRDLEMAGEQALDPAEDIEVLHLPLAEVLAALRRNELILDAASVAALQLAEARLGSER